MSKGNELYRMLIELTGLEHGALESELGGLMKRLNLDPEKVTTGDIRLLVATYLQEVQAGMTASKSLWPEVLDATSFEQAEA